MLVRHRFKKHRLFCLIFSLGGASSCERQGAAGHETLVICPGFNLAREAHCVGSFAFWCGAQSEVNHLSQNSRGGSAKRSRGGPAGLVVKQGAR